MSGSDPAIARSGPRKSPSSTVIARAANVIRTGANGSANLSTILPRIARATFGRRSTPCSTSPNMLGAMPLSTNLPSRTSGGACGSVGTGAS
jgi:hypothetical protein